MDTVELFKTAGVAIRTNKTRSVLTTLGIIIGVASVILLVAVGNGLQAYVTGEFEALGANRVMVMPGKVKFGSAPPGFGVEAKFDFEDGESGDSPRKIYKRGYGAQEPDGRGDRS